ncbi:MAG: hypothetical protein ACLFSW_03095 [Halobacteriales archaeon]
MTECDYCGSYVHAHDPVFTMEEREFRRVETGAFCNYACLSAYIDDEALADGAACSVDLDV